MEGPPKFAESQRLPDVDHAGFAQSHGLQTVRVTDPGQLEDAWRRAFAADRPTVPRRNTAPWLGAGRRRQRPHMSPICPGQRLRPHLLAMYRPRLELTEEEQTKHSQKR